MLTLALHFFVWTLLIIIGLGGLLLIGIACILGFMFIAEIRAACRSLERRRSEWAHIADPWDGFDAKLSALRSQSPISKTAPLAARPNRAFGSRRTPIDRGEHGGGIYIEM